jgi:2-isopropylmalate synthase
MALVNLKDNENSSEEVFEVANGNGGVDAGVNAVKKITGTKAYIKAFNLVAITGGSDALCEVSVTVEEEFDGTVLKVFGNGMSIDISVAGIFSFVDAINKLEYMKKAGIRKVSITAEGV